MYRITTVYDAKDTLAETCTIDAAIVEVKKRSKDDGAARAVRDGTRIRVVAVGGRAFWAETCKPCKGSGMIGVAHFYGGQSPCDKCHGIGSVDGRQCQ